MISELMSNTITFFVLCSVSITWLVFAKRLYNDALPLGWIALAIGVYMYALARLCLIVGLPIMAISSIELMAGALFIIGDVLVLTQITEEFKYLRNRQKEIKSVMKNLKTKYFKREIDEEQLRKLYSELIKELAEIEVKMKKKRT